MSYGFETTNLGSRVQVTQDYSNSRLIASGSVSESVASSNVDTDTRIQIPYSVTAEVPLVLIRPWLTGKFVGAVQTSGPFAPFPGDPGTTNGFISIHGQCGFDYAIFSTKGTAVNDGSAWGLEVYRADGSVAYSSKHQHARITQLLYKPADSSAVGGYPNVYSISGFSSMPWIIANPLRVTDQGVNDYSTSQGCVMASVNSAFTQVTFDFRDAAAISTSAPYYRTFPVFPSLTDRAAYNPYGNRPIWFGVGTFA